MGSLRKSVLLFGLLSLFTAHAQDTEEPMPASDSTKKKEFGTQAGDWFTRLRALYILPNDSSGSVNTIPHSGVSVHPSWTGEFDFGYMFTKNLGFELILATSKHSLWGKDSLSGTKIGTTWVLPPTLNVQWRFFPHKIFQPYVGAGVNFTLFYGIDCSLAGTSLDLSNSWGPEVQGGLDLFFSGNWLLNLDFKYIWINTEGHLKGATAGKVHVDINPFVLGFGIGRKW